MKKYFWILAGLVLVIFTGCKSDPINNPMLSFTVPSIELQLGEEIVIPLTHEHVSSFDELVFSFTENGIVEQAEDTLIAQGIGTTVLTVSVASNPSISAILFITVLPEPIVYEIPTLIGPKVLVVGDDANYTITNYTDLALFEWQITNSTVATIDESGYIIALQEGMTQVKAILKEDSTIFSSIELTIYSPIHPAPLYEIFVGESHQIELSNILTNNHLFWESSNESIATVSASGIVTAHQVGFTTITITNQYVSSLTSSFTLKISMQFDSLEDAYPVFVVEKRRVELEETIPIRFSNYADLNDFSWVFSDPTIATLSDDFYLVPLKVGIVTLFATHKDNEDITEAIAFEIYELPTQAPILTAAKTTLEIGDRVRIDIENYSNRELFDWSYTNEDIFTINTSFLLSAMEVGMVTITATMKDNPTLIGTLTLTIIPIQPVIHTPTNHLFVGGMTSIAIGNEEQMDADISGFTIEIGDATILEINSSNQITGLLPGTTTITVTSTLNPAQTATMEFSVYEQTTSFTPKQEPIASPLILSTANPESMVEAGLLFPIVIHQAKNQENYVWTSMDSSISTVNDSGRVIAVQAGRVEIAVFSKEDSSIRGSIFITVYGIPNVDYVSRVLMIALEEEGYVEGYNNNTKYGAWYGLNYEPWCAMFVSWVAFEAGVSTEIIPRFAGVQWGMDWFKARGLFEPKMTNGVYYLPKPGDIIIFKDAGASHTGIVTKYENGIVYTIEGNTSNRVAQRSYSISHTTITGYGTPLYPPFDGTPIEVDTGNADDGSNHGTT